MNSTENLNRGLWAIAKWGVPSAIIVFIIAAVLKLRMIMVLTDFAGILLVGVIILALITDLVLHLSAKGEKPLPPPAQAEEPSSDEVSS